MNFNILNSPLSKRASIIAIILAILAIGNIFLGVKCFLESQQTQVMQKQLKAQQNNEKMVAFLNLFIDKVLMAQTEVSFEDRLRLENTVRDLQDNDVLAQWEKFTGSGSEAQVQTEAKKLLALLAKKISN